MNSMLLDLGLGTPGTWDSWDLGLLGLGTPGTWDSWDLGLLGLGTWDFDCVKTFLPKVPASNSYEILPDLRDALRRGDPPILYEGRHASARGRRAEVCRAAERESRRAGRR